MDILWEESFLIPDNVLEGTYNLEIGIETGVDKIGNIKLAIAGEKNGYYQMGKILIERD